MSFRRVVRSLVLVAVVALFSGSLHAEPSAPLVSYRGPPGCPSARDFSEQVAARTRLFRPGELAVRVELEAAPDGVLGRVTLERGGRETEREISGARCAEVVEALALIVAILIDPAADTGPLPSRAPAEASPGPPPEPEASEVAPAARVWFVHAGAELGAQGAIAPRLAFGPGAFIALVRSPTGPLGSLRLSLFQLRSGTITSANDAFAAFELSAARLDACLLGLESGSLRLEPCVLFEGGLLAADGTHPERSGSETVGWAASGAGLRAGIEHARVLFVQAGAFLMVPLVRYRFGFEGEAPLQTTPALSADFRLGVGVRFP